MRIQKEVDYIPTHVVETDIKDTQIEIDQFQRELDALMGNRVENRLLIYMLEGKISQRKDFIDKLNSILESRKEIA